VVVMHISRDEIPPNDFEASSILKEI
jgi:hypothetical protein